MTAFRISGELAQRSASGHDLPSWPIAPNDRLGVELSRSAIARSEWAPPRRAEIAADFWTWGEGGYGKAQAAPFMSSRLFKMACAWGCSAPTSTASKCLPTQGAGAQHGREYQLLHVPALRRPP